MFDSSEPSGVDKLSGHFIGLFQSESLLRMVNVYLDDSKSVSI